MARFIFTPFGSGGDVNPHLWMGRLLAARGHEVRVITVPMFREMTERAGLPFTGVGTEEEFMAIVHDKKLWKPLAGTRLVLHHALRATPLYFDAIARELSRGPAVIVSPFHLFAARAAREKFGVPLVTTHLQPACFLSEWDTPVFMNGMEWFNKLPRWLKRFFLTTFNPVNGMVRPGLRKFCATIGIAAPARLLPEWMHSPDANLALFPEWFAKPQLDWPANTHMTGFPQEDLRGQFTLPRELEEFLAPSDKPVLLSPGTGNAQSQDFFAAALDACEKLKLRALVGTRFPEQLPQPLPLWARAFEYLPFSALLPQVSVIVHHGGIGTMSQALAAGVPQLVMPMAHDQPDNAHRLKQFGCGSALSPWRFTATRIARELQRLLGDESVKTNCERVALLCQEGDAAGIAVARLENIARKITP